MKKPSAEAFVKSLEELLEERRVLAEKEEEVIASLNGVLSRMGYQVIPASVNHTSAAGRRRGRRPGRRPGRPRKTPLPELSIPAAPKRRGRPPKKVTK